MKSGRSSSDGTICRAAAIATLTSLLLTPGAPSAQEAIPPPPDVLDASPSASPRPAPKREQPRHVCPRCGYRCDPGWNYCLACGWDMRTLVGEAEESRLQAIARSSVGVTVGGRRNRYATAFPFGGQGLFVTSARALIGAGQIRLRTFNNREYPATFVGYDLPTGVGLLRADIPDLPLLEVAPASPAPPESSWAVCYPVVFDDDLVHQLPVSLHRGHLTAAGQAGTFLVSFEDLLRTDHAIEQGCNGGPLIDARGRLAGIILGSPEDGITYAAPLEGLAPTVAVLVRQEQPVRPYFGIGVVMPDERRRAKFGLDAAMSRPLIAYVIPGSPAALADVRPGDSLVAVGADEVAGIRQAWTRLLAAEPGGPGIALTLGRAGEKRQVMVKPIRRPERVMLDPVDEIQETLEANLKEVTSGPGSQQGLLVTDLVRGGRGEKGRFRNGDLIIGIDDKSIKTGKAFGDYIRGRSKELIQDRPLMDRRFPSSYVISLEVRTARQQRVTREYVNLFPDILAPPVY